MRFISTRFQFFDGQPFAPGRFRMIGNPEAIQNGVRGDDIAATLDEISFPPTGLERSMAKEKLVLQLTSCGMAKALHLFS